MTDSSGAGGAEGDRRHITPWDVLLALLREVPAAAVELGRDGRQVTRASASFAELTGLDIAELVRAAHPFCWVAESSSDDLEAMAESAIRSPRSVRRRIDLHRSDGTPVPTVATGIALADGAGGTSSVLVVFDEIRLIDGVLDDLDRRRHGATLAEERERIGRDLHDNAIQRLLVVGLELDILSERSAAADVRAGIGRAVNALDEAVAAIRASVFRLRHHLTESDLAAELHRTIDEMAGVLSRPPVLHLSGALTSVPERIASNITAVIRELITNVARHANSTMCEVHVTIGDGWVSVMVEDDGSGIRERTAREGGRGLVNVADRAAVLGGESSVESRHPTGTIVRWRVPISPAGDDRSG